MLIAVSASATVPTTSARVVVADGGQTIPVCTAEQLGLVQLQGTPIFDFETRERTRDLPSGVYSYTATARSAINQAAVSRSCNPTGAPTDTFRVFSHECLPVFDGEGGLFACISTGNFDLFIGASAGGVVRAWLDPAVISTGTESVTMSFSGPSIVVADAPRRARATWYTGTHVGFVRPSESVQGFPADTWTRAFTLSPTATIAGCGNGVGGFYQSGSVQRCEFALSWDSGAKEALAEAGPLLVSVQVPWAYWQFNDVGNGVIGSAVYSSSTLAVGSGDLDGPATLDVELSGGETETAGVVEVTAVITNDSDTDLTDIVWDAGGLQQEEVVNPNVIDVIELPTAELPTDLSSGESVTLRWRFAVTGNGIVVFSLGGTGQAGTVTVESGLVELSLVVGDRDIVLEDLRRAIDLGVRSLLTDSMAAIDGLGGVADDHAEALAADATRSEAAFQRAYESYRSLGFSHWSARVMAANDLSKEAWQQFWTSFGQARTDRLDENAQGFMSGIFSFYYAMRDPTARSVMSAQIGEAVREHVPTVREFVTTATSPSTGGLLGEALRYYADKGPDLLAELGLAGRGQLEITRQSRDLLSSDPIAWAEQNGGRYGQQLADVEFIMYTGVAEEAATAATVGLYRGGKAVVAAGAAKLRNSGSSLTAPSAAVDGATDAVGSAMRRLDEADDAVRRFQDLPYGTQVDLADLERLGGFDAADVSRIESLISEVNETYGVNLRIVARTAEPLSVGIDGVGKRQFTSYKAVGVLDQQMGAPEVLGGRVSVFEPQPLSPRVVEALEYAEPGFAARYAERLATQQKYWDDWQSGTGRMNRLVEGSVRHDGITVINEVPHRPTYDVDYLEQLDEPAFVQSRGWSESEVTQIRNELATYPSRTPANLRAEVVTSGAVTFTDVTGTGGDARRVPIISDYDLQAVIPEGGWPPGRRAQIEVDVKRRFDQIGRSGQHGWSHTANDLPSAYFDKAAEYILATTHPSLAETVATDILRRFRLLGDEFAGRAARLDAADPRRAELERIAAKFRAYLTADGNGGWTVTATNIEELLSKFPPGEKTIVFSQGRVTVGSGDGTP